MSSDAKLVAQLGVEPSPFASEATVLETVCASRTLLRNKKSKRNSITSLLKNSIVRKEITRY